MQKIISFANHCWHFGITSRNESNQTSAVRVCMPWTHNIIPWLASILYARFAPNWIIYNLYVNVHFTCFCNHNVFGINYIIAHEEPRWSSLQRSKMKWNGNRICGRNACVCVCLDGMKRSNKHIQRENIVSIKAYCAPCTALTCGKYDEYERNHIRMQARLHTYTKHTVIVNVVGFHFHVFIFYCYCRCSMLGRSLARLVCAFVISSLNVHFICLGIKNNLIIYRINVHIELHCVVTLLLVVVLAARAEGMHSRSRTREYYAVSFHSSAANNCCSLFGVVVIVGMSAFKLQFVVFCLSLLVPIRSSLPLQARNCVRGRSDSCAIYMQCRQCPVHGIEYQ